MVVQAPLLKTWHDHLDSLDHFFSDRVSLLKDQRKQLAEQEDSFLNFMSPENWWGLSTFANKGYTNSYREIAAIDRTLADLDVYRAGIRIAQHSVNQGKLPDLNKEYVGHLIHSVFGREMNPDNAIDFSPEVLKREQYTGSLPIDGMIDICRTLKKYGSLSAARHFTKEIGKAAPSDLPGIGMDLLLGIKSTMNALFSPDMILLMAFGGYLGGLFGRSTAGTTAGALAAGSSRLVDARFIIPGVLIFRNFHQANPFFRFRTALGNILGEMIKFGAEHETIRGVLGERAAKFYDYYFGFFSTASPSYQHAWKITLAGDLAAGKANSFLDFMAANRKSDMVARTLENMGDVANPNMLRNSLVARAESIAEREAAARLEQITRTEAKALLAQLEAVAAKNQLAAPMLERARAAESGTVADAREFRRAVQQELDRARQAIYDSDHPKHVRTYFTVPGSRSPSGGSRGGSAGGRYPNGEAEPPATELPTRAAPVVSTPLQMNINNPPATLDVSSVANLTDGKVVVADTFAGNLAGFYAQHGWFRKGFWQFVRDVSGEGIVAARRVKKRVLEGRLQRRFGDYRMFFSKQYTQQGEIFYLLEGIENRGQL